MCPQEAALQASHASAHQGSHPAVQPQRCLPGVIYGRCRLAHPGINMQVRVPCSDLLACHCLTVDCRAESVYSFVCTHVFDVSLPHFACQCSMVVCSDSEMCHECKSHRDTRMISSRLHTRARADQVTRVVPMHGDQTLIATIVCVGVPGATSGVSRPPRGGFFVEVASVKKFGPRYTQGEKAHASRRVRAYQISRTAQRSCSCRPGSQLQNAEVSRIAFLVADKASESGVAVRVIDGQLQER